MNDGPETSGNMAAIHTLWFAVLLTFGNGFMDAYTYLTSGAVYTQGMGVRAVWVVSIVATAALGRMLFEQPPN